MLVLNKTIFVVLLPESLKLQKSISYWSEVIKCNFNFSATFVIFFIPYTNVVLGMLVSRDFSH